MFYGVRNPLLSVFFTRIGNEILGCVEMGEDEVKMQTRFFYFSLSLCLVIVGCGQYDNFYANVLRSDVFYQAYDDHKYDFLWVFDNSGSMKERRDFVKDNMQQFLNILNSRKAIDFQMAVVTTDFFTEGGKLIASTSGQEVVKSVESTDPVADVATIINQIKASKKSFWEQGLESAYQAVFLHGWKFSRPGVPLVIIFLTDEDDWSCKEECWGSEPENNDHWVPFPMDRYITYFQNVKKIESTDTFVFPVTGISGTNCEVASYGTRYIQLAEAIGGVSRSGSICNADLKESYEKIAEVIADRGVRFRLNSQSSGEGISVYINQKLVPYSPDNYIYDKENNEIIFTGAAPKNGDIVQVAYEQNRL